MLVGDPYKTHVTICDGRFQGLTNMLRPWICWFEWSHTKSHMNECHQLKSMVNAGQASRGTLAIPITELRGETQTRLKQCIRSCKTVEKKPDGLATLYSDRCLTGQLRSMTMTHSAYSLPPGSRMKEELRPEFLFLMPHSPYRVQLVPLRLIRKMGEEPFEKALCKVCRMGDNINLKYGYKFKLRLLNIAEAPSFSTPFHTLLNRGIPPVQYPIV